jgi:hypothetical protein
MHDIRGLLTMLLFASKPQNWMVSMVCALPRLLVVELLGNVSLLYDLSPK